VQGSFDQIRCEHDGIMTDCWKGSLELPADGGE
jgi:hypothetical protein